MNFYIGDSYDEINLNGENAEINDDLHVYLCKISKKIPYDLGALCGIDPYNDVKISKSKVIDLLKTGQCILVNSLLMNYETKHEGKEEGEQSIRELIRIAENAIKREKGLISVGD